MVFRLRIPKNVRANVNKKELQALQDLATDLLRLDMKQLDAHVNNQLIQEICLDDKN